ncbi:MAG TPA: glycosyltransferase family 2 protein, partial [Candidatus Omnitrophota bacterium]|nr:glycosyltransferase family 2 protein [Candidatus Omnitrophota bacterium]
MDLGWLFIIYFLYFSALLFYYLFLGVIGLFEGKKRQMQHESEDYEAFAVSNFTIPVSIIVPAHNEEAWIEDCVRSLLNLEYPEFEIIIVNDGSTDSTLERMVSLLDLEALHNPYMDHFQSGENPEKTVSVYGIYRSKKYPNVKLLSKASGYKKAGAINAGLNFAKYKYICVIDADTILEPDAFLKVMVHVEKDPENIIGIGSYFGLVNGFNVEKGHILERSFSYRPIIAYQNLEYIRSFIGNRVAWSRLNASPIISGGFAVWRRDIVMELGGFSHLYSSEDLEFTFRVRDHIAKNNKKYRILMLPYHVGWTFGPDNVGALITQRNRWQRVTNEAVRHYRHMIFNYRYGWFGLFTAPYFLFYEMFGVFFELSSLIIAIIGLFSGVVTPGLFFTFLFFVILSQPLVSLIYMLSFVRS